jgi:tetratricopeptide (TPR) repeat protein
VRDVVLGRVARLGPAIERVLTVASVIGETFSLGTLEALPDAGEPDGVLPAIEAGIRAGLVREVDKGVFAFSHALARHAIYDTLTATRRTRLHGRIGEVLERLGTATEEVLAHHFTIAAPDGHAEASARHSLAAADEALRQAAFDRAAAHLDTALGVAREGDLPLELRFELLMERANVAAVTEDYDTATALHVAAAQAAREIGTGTRLAEAALATFRALETTRSDHLVVELCEEAVAALGADRPDLRARVLARLAGERANDQGLDALPLVDAALEEARRSGDPIAVYEALAETWTALGASPDQRYRRRIVEEVATVELPPHYRHRSRRLFLGPRSAELISALILGDREAVDQAVAGIEAESDRTGRPDHRSEVRNWRAIVALLEGRFDDAESLLDSVGDVQDAGLRNTLLAQRFWLATERGQAAELVPLVSAMVGEAGLGEAYRAGLAFVAALSGERELAEEALEALLPDTQLLIPTDYIYVASTCLATEAAARLGDRRRATVLHAVLAPYGGQQALMGGAAMSVGPVDRYRALAARTVGHLDEALELLESALEQDLVTKAHASRAHTYLELGRTLHAQGRADHRPWIVQARDLAEELGMAGVVAEAEALATS